MKDMNFQTYSVDGSEETKNKIRQSKIYKKLCGYCKKLFVDLDKHDGNCRKNPANKERFHNERRAYLEKEDIKTRVQFQKGTVWRKWYKKNKWKLNEKRRNRPQEKKNISNAQHNISRKNEYSKNRYSLIHILGGPICSNVECRFNDLRALQIDHIHNTGHLDNMRFHNDDRIRNAYYLKHPYDAVENLQMLCANCNTIKEYERKKILKKSDKPRNIKNRGEYSKMKNLAIDILGGFICVKCSFKDHRSLDIDHIHGKGNLDRSNHNRQNELYAEIIKNPDESKKKFQILCRNCNEIKERITESDNN